MSAAPAGEAADFDLLARAYRWLEYATFGPFLERCRFEFLRALGDRRRALILGDGDGRFTARLMREVPDLEADCVDASAGMLELLKSRAPRARVQRTDIRGFTPSRAGYDLVATHFFLDCLSQTETAALIARLKPSLAPGALWVVSEFAVPQHGPMRPAACALIAALYRAFRLLTGLRADRVPDYAAALAAAGFRPLSVRTRLWGLLRAELWGASRAT